MLATLTALFRPLISGTFGSERKEGAELIRLACARAAPLAAAALLFASGLCAEESGRAPLEGVWRIVEVRSVGPNGERVVSDPPPSLLIFSARHYSMVWNPRSQPRDDFENSFRPSDAEKIAAYDTLAVNTGTYELEGSQLVTRPVVSRVPDFSGGVARYEYRLSGDELSLNLLEEYSREGAEHPLWKSVSIHLKLARVVE